MRHSGRSEIGFPRHSFAANLSRVAHVHVRPAKLFHHILSHLMPTAQARASTILAAFDQAQAELIGKAVILTDGKAGTVGQNLA
jgi:hypothetical protein